MAQVDKLRDVEQLLKRFGSCRPVYHRNSTIIESPSPEKVAFLLPPSASTDPQLKTAHGPAKDYFELSNIKYRNYKYVKCQYAPTFYKEIGALSNIKKHSHRSKDKKIESIFGNRKSELSIDQKYKIEKTERVLKSRYENARKPKLKNGEGKSLERTVQLMNELKMNIQKLNVTNNKKMNFWVSPYMARAEMEAKIPLSRNKGRLTELECCVKLFRELLRLDLQKNVRLNIKSSCSQKRELITQEGHKPTGKSFVLKEDSKYWSGFGSLAEEKVSFESLNEHFNDKFNKRLWNRVFFGLGLPVLPLEEQKLAFADFMEFFKIVLSKSASRSKKLEFLTRVFTYPEETPLKMENIECFLKSDFLGKRVESGRESAVLTRRLWDQIQDSRDSLDEIIEFVFFRKNYNNSCFEHRF